MAITNHERVGKMLELLTAGLAPFVERELKATNVPDWFAETNRLLADNRLKLEGTPDKPQWDAAAILATMWSQWNAVFRKTLGQAERTLVSELRDVPTAGHTNDRSARMTPIAHSTACTPSDGRFGPRGG